MNRIVKSLMLRESLFVGHDLGDLGKTLPSPNKTLNLLMIANPIGVILQVSLPRPGSIVREYMVPWQGVLRAELGQDFKIIEAPKSEPTPAA